MRLPTVSISDGCSQPIKNLSITEVSLVVLAFFFVLVPNRSPRAQNPMEVARERRVIPGYSEPNTPPNVPISEALRSAVTDREAMRSGQVNLNQAIYVRFFDRSRTAPPKFIAIFLPGLAVGANNFAVLARELVRLSNGDAEAWAVDLRSNLLEDTTGMREAEGNGTVAAALSALSAYRNHAAGRGGYIANHPFEVSRFMSEWGLDVHLRDFKAIVEQARSVGGTSQPKVFLAGHDFYGSSLAAHFAAYNFDGAPGYTLLSGLVLLDGTPAPNAPDPRAPRPPSDSAYLNDGAMFGTLRLPGLNVLRNPRGPGDEPFLFTDRFNPFRLQLREIVAQLAAFDPEAASALPAEFGPPVPATNAATLALGIDDEFSDSEDERYSVGFLRLPAGGGLSDVAAQKQDPEGANPNGLFVPRSLGVDAVGNPILQRWNNLKDLSTIGLSGKEPSDLPSVARGFFVGEGGSSTPSSEANYLQWYYPKRLLLDMLLASNLRPRLSTALVMALRERGGNSITETENARVNIPILGLSAERGILVHNVPSPFPFSFVYSSYVFSLQARPPFFSKLLPDYAHRDPTWSAEPLVPSLLIQFMTTGRPN